jgi:hypothetical protein
MGNLEMITISTSFSKSLSIMNLILSSERLEDILKTKSEYLYFDAYQNGREQGVCLHLNYKINYFIAQDRHSDWIIVYKGKASNQSISEDAYQNARGFEYIEQAVEFIIESVINDIGEL